MLLFLIPAPVLALDQMLPKASPPLEDGLAAGFEKLAVEAGVGRPPVEAGVEEGAGAWTEVK